MSLASSVKRSSSKTLAQGPSKTLAQAPSKTLTDAPRYPAPAVGHAVRIINYLIAAGDGAGVSEIARALSMNKSTCFGILNTLMSFQVLSKHPRYAIYRLGPRLVEWGTASRRQFSRQTIIHEKVEALVADIKLTCLIGQVLADGHGIVVVDRVEPARPDVSTLPVGYVVPMSGPAMGGIVLAYMDDSDALKEANRHGLIRDGKTADYLAELHAVRARGYSISAGEFRSEVNAVAAAITRGHAEIITILCIVGFAHHLQVSELDMLGKRLAATARQLEMHESVATL
jgi:IclR family transcriptional regulator, KDG regulon repressor